MSHTDKSVEALRGRFGEGVEAVQVFRDQTTVVLRAEVIQQACEMLRDDLQYDLLAALTAVDYWPQEPRFAVVYQVVSLPNHAWLGLKVRLGGDSARLASVASVYPNANWHEREVFDMFGVQFAEHPDLRRILMPHDWEGHPLRKDYPLGYEEVQFSFNFEEIDRRKRYARE